MIKSLLLCLRKSPKDPWSFKTTGNLAQDMRRLGDLLWSEGNKSGSSLCHDVAREIVDARREIENMRATALSFQERYGQELSEHSNTIVQVAQLVNAGDLEGIKTLLTGKGITKEEIEQSPAEELAEQLAKEKAQCDAGIHCWCWKKTGICCDCGERAK